MFVIIKEANDKKRIKLRLYKIKSKDKISTS